MKRFYITVTIITVLLCLAGCGEKDEKHYIDYSSYKPFVNMGTPERSPAAAKYGGGDRKAVIEHRAGSSDDTAQTTFTPFKKFSRITDLFGNSHGSGGEEAETTADRNWFKFGSGGEVTESETWYRFPKNDTEYTKVIRLNPAETRASSHSDTVKEPDQPKSTIKVTTKVGLR